jgi:preprotein translocase subunit SecA
VLHELERRVILSVLDRKWREHLYEMDYLQEGIGLRGYGQRDPVVEYQREAFDMFSAMMEGIKEESVGFLFNLEVQTEEEPPPPAAAAAVPSFPSYDAGETPQQPAIGVLGEPVPSEAPAEPTTERDRVANVLGQALGQPKRPQGLQYSAPSVDGDGGVITRAEGGGKNAGARPAAASSDDGASNREARRKAAKQQRKR